jgi:hypothetical protein
MPSVFSAGQVCQDHQNHAMIPVCVSTSTGDTLHLVHVVDSPADYWVGPDDTAIVYSDPATDGRDVRPWVHQHSMADT